MVESLESQHRLDPLLHSPMVLLHQIVQVLTGSKPGRDWKVRRLLLSPAPRDRCRIGIHRDLGGRVFFIAPRRKALAALTSRLRLKKKSTVGPALSTARYK